MKNKKGLGSIPKSLAWIDADASETIVPAKQEPIQKIPEKKQQQKRPALKEKQTDNDIALQQSSSLSVDEIKHPVSDKTTSCQGLPEGWTRATFIVKQEINEKLKALAYWDRVTVKEVMHDALTIYLQDKNVRAMPKKKDII